MDQWSTPRCRLTSVQFMSEARAGAGPAPRLEICRLGRTSPHGHSTRFSRPFQQTDSGLLSELQNDMAAGWMGRLHFPLLPTANGSVWKSPTHCGMGIMEAQL